AAGRQPALAPPACAGDGARCRPYRRDHGARRRHLPRKPGPLVLRRTAPPGDRPGPVRPARRDAQSPKNVTGGEATMKVKVGDHIPATTLYRLVDGGPEA